MNMTVWASSNSHSTHAYISVVYQPFSPTANLSLDSTLLFINGLQLGILQIIIPAWLQIHISIYHQIKSHTYTTH